MVTSQWRSSTAVLAISLDSGHVQRMSQHDTDRASWTFAATCQGDLSLTVCMACQLHILNCSQHLCRLSESVAEAWVCLLQEQIACMRHIFCLWQCASCIACKHAVMLQTTQPHKQFVWDVSK